MEIKGIRKEQIKEHLLTVNELETGGKFVYKGIEIPILLRSTMIGEYEFCDLSFLNLHFHGHGMDNISLSKIGKEIAKIEHRIKSVVEIAKKYQMRVDFEIHKGDLCDIYNSCINQFTASDVITLLRSVNMKSEMTLILRMHKCILSLEDIDLMIQIQKEFIDRLVENQGIEETGEV